MDSRPVAPTYPEGTARKLLMTDLVTPRTRAVLAARLEAPREPQPRVLGNAEYATLRAACGRLIPQDERAKPIDLAGEIERRLARGESKGWRYDVMPPDLDAFRHGLRGVDESARAMFGAPFAALENGSQEEVLRAVQRGEAPGVTWNDLPASRFFEELLAETVEIYYSHPLAYDEIGYVGYADARGWQAVGLNRLAPHEPRPEEGQP